MVSAVAALSLSLTSFELTHRILESALTTLLVCLCKWHQSTSSSARRNSWSRLLEVNDAFVSSLFMNEVFVHPIESTDYSFALNLHQSIRTGWPHHTLILSMNAFHFPAQTLHYVQQDLMIPKKLSYHIWFSVTHVRTTSRFQSVSSYWISMLVSHSPSSLNIRSNSLDDRHTRH